MHIIAVHARGTRFARGGNAIDERLFEPFNWTIISRTLFARRFLSLTFRVAPLLETVEMNFEETEWRPCGSARAQAAPLRTFVFVLGMFHERQFLLLIYQNLYSLV